LPANPFALKKPPPVNGVAQWGRANNGAAGSIFNSPAIRSILGGGRTMPAFNTGMLDQIRGVTQSSGGGGGGGGNPAAGIMADYLSKMRADTNAASIADAASRDAAIKRLVISYGQVPDFAAFGLDDKTNKIIMNALDQKTRDLAQANTDQGTSVYARMAKDNMVANRRIPAQLAGRGMLRSGQTVSDLSDQAQNYKNSSFDTINEVLNNATGAIGQFAAAERQRQEQLAQMELQAALAAAEQGYGSGGGGSDPGGGSNPSNPSNAGVSTASVGAAAAKKFLGLKAGKKVLVSANSPFRRK